MGPVVSLRAAVALLGRFPALAGIDLAVERGEVVLLRGPNGAGKTSLLRTCAGILPVVSGEATVLGHDLCVASARRAVRRRVGLLGHGSGLYDDLTVEDNVRFWSRAAGAAPADATAALAHLALDGRLASVPVAKLSAGQRRRTAIACVVARRAELWLLDEPHAGLDQAGRDVLDRLITDAAAAGATVLVASHDLDRATRVATRTVTIAGGTVVQAKDASVLRDAALVAGKDLRIELRSRVTTNQVAPFALLVLLLFGFALDADRVVLDRATPGLFWLAVLFASLLATQRAFGIEAADGTSDALRLSGLAPAGILLGKAVAVALQLLALQVVLLLGVVVLYGTDIEGAALLAATCVVATIGLAAAGGLYGALASGLRVRDTLLPLLLLPILAPVLIASTRAFEAALGTVGVDGWAWVNLLAVFAAVYVVLVLACAGPLLEDA